jgi:drug/metabolite transporter (DMT)-like permease
MKKYTLNIYHLAVAFSSIPLAFAGPLGRLALNYGATPLIISFWRMLFATILTGLFVVLSPPARRSVRRLNGWLLGKSLLAGCLMAGHFLAWYAALDKTTIFNVTVLGALQPFFAMAGGWLLYRSKVRAQAIPGIIVVVLGAVVMGLMSLNSGGQASFSGDLLAVLTTLLFSAYLLAGESIRKDIPAALYMLILYGGCTLFLLAAALLSGQSLMPADIRIIVICGVLTLSGTFLVHSVFNWSVHHVGALFITIVSLTEPVGATLVGWLFFQEAPKALALLGGLLILAGVYWFLNKQYSNIKTKQPQTEA